MSAELYVHRELSQTSAVKRRILEQIENGRMGDTRRLPGERQLCEDLQTSRNTLREALAQLESEGVVYREDRRGWFISPPRLVYNPLKRGDFEAMAIAQGRAPRTVLLESGVAPPPPVICAMAGFEPGTLLYRIRRARLLDDRPVLYVEHYLMPELFPRLLEHDLTISLTKIARTSYNLTRGRVVFHMTPTALVGEAALMLRVSSGSPALKIARVNYDQHSRPMDCDIEYWRQDAVLVAVDATENHP